MKPKLTRDRLWRLPVDVPLVQLTRIERFWYQRPRARRWWKHNTPHFIYGLIVIACLVPCFQLATSPEVTTMDVEFAIILGMLVLGGCWPLSFMMGHWVAFFFRVGQFVYCPRCEAAVRPLIFYQLRYGQRIINCPSCGQDLTRLAKKSQLDL